MRDGESSDCGIYLWTNYYPDVATLVEVSNCRIYNFTKGVGITAYVSSLDESESARKCRKADAVGSSDDCRM